MKILDTGHRYQLAHQTGGGAEEFQFVCKEAGREAAGTTTQEVLRALIDRTRHCNNCLPHPNNERIIYHLRMALVLHEARAMERRAEKGDFRPEDIHVGPAGHYRLSERVAPLGNETRELTPYNPDWNRQPLHRPAPVDRTPLGEQLVQRLVPRSA